MTSDAGRLRAQKVAAIVAAAAVLAIAYRLGIFDELADLDHATRALSELGVWGYLAFVLAYAVLQPFGVPGTVFIVAASLIWPWPLAFALSMTGTMAASVVGFSFARFVARDWVAKRVPPRFKKYEDVLEARGFTTVFLLRLVFWMPSLLHAFFGVSAVRFSTHFWGSLAGYVLPLLLVSYFGPKFFDAMRDTPAQLSVGLGAALGIAALAVWGGRALLRTRC